MKWHHIHIATKIAALAVGVPCEVYVYRRHGCGSPLVVTDNRDVAAGIAVELAAAGQGTTLLASPNYMDAVTILPDGRVKANGTFEPGTGDIYLGFCERKDLAGLSRTAIETCRRLFGKITSFALWTVPTCGKDNEPTKISENDPRELYNLAALVDSCMGLRAECTFKAAHERTLLIRAFGLRMHRGDHVDLSIHLLKKESDDEQEN